MATEPALQGIEFCIRDRNKVPNGGFYFVTSSAAKVECGNWYGLQKKVVLWYDANDITLPDDIEAQVDRQICERQVAAKNYDYCQPCASTPGITNQVVSVARAAYGFWKQGGSKEIYDARKLICAGDKESGKAPCTYWRGDARMGYGKCAACGCGNLKMFIKTEHCRIGKW